MRKGFKYAEFRLESSGLDYSNSGTSCVAIQMQRNTLCIANLGDSRVVLCRVLKSDKLAIELSHDHRAMRSDENERINKFGGLVEKLTHNGQTVGPYRVWATEDGPGLAFTRTLGNIQAKKIGIISHPEIFDFEQKYGDKFIVIASDGIWDVMTSAEVIGFVMKHQNEEDPSKQLALEARKRWKKINQIKKVNNWIGDHPLAKCGIDDICCIICFFFYQIDENCVRKNLNESENSFE